MVRYKCIVQKVSLGISNQEEIIRWPTLRNDWNATNFESYMKFLYIQCGPSCPPGLISSETTRRKHKMDVIYAYDEGAFTGINPSQIHYNSIITIISIWFIGFGIIILSVVQMKWIKWIKWIKTIYFCIMCIKWIKWTKSKLMHQMDRMNQMNQMHQTGSISASQIDNNDNINILSNHQMYPMMHIILHTYIYKIPR